MFARVVGILMAVGATASIAATGDLPGLTDKGWGVWVLIAVVIGFFVWWTFFRKAVTVTVNVTSPQVLEVRSNGVVVGTPKASLSPAPAGMPNVETKVGAAAPEYVPHRLSNTPNWRVHSDTTPEGYPIFYTLNADGVVDQSKPYKVYYDGRWMLPTEVAEARVKLLAREGDLAKAQGVVK